MTSRTDTKHLRRRTDLLVAGYLLTTALLAAAFRENVPQWKGAPQHVLE